jgi:hypothetical protein
MCQGTTSQSPEKRFALKGHGFSRAARTTGNLAQREIIAQFDGLKDTRLQLEGYGL